MTDKQNIEVHEGRRQMARQGEELSPVTRGEWDERRFELTPT